MRLTDVDEQKRNPVAKVLIESLKGASLAPEGRSRVTSKDEHEGPALMERRSRDATLSVVRL